MISTGHRTWLVLNKYLLNDSVVVNRIDSGIRLFGFEFWFYLLRAVPRGLVSSISICLKFGIGETEI